MTIPKDNFELALAIAIQAREKFERETLQYTMDSGFVAGLKEILKASYDGEQVTIQS